MPAAETPAATPTRHSVSETLQLFSHDIRSAMSDVVGGLRLIELDKLDADTRLQLDRVQAAGDTLAALVDAALMAAAGDTLIQSEAPDVDLANWLAAQAGRWAGRAREHGCVFRVDPPDAMPDRLRVPQVTLDRLLGNLISNALHHADGAPVTLSVTATRGQGVTLGVMDKGSGYPDAVLALVTRRGEAAPMGLRAGSGLGLRIVAELSRQIGGRLDLRNADTGGGIALLHLPDAAVIWDSGPASTCRPPDLGGLRLLVAEDNLTNQTILRQLLGQMHAAPVFVADGVAAIEMLERQSFDLALVDIEMPRMSGLDVMRHVRASGAPYADMPLVALTAYVLRDNREAIYAAGADGIIGKPISSGTEFGLAILRHAGRSADVFAAGQAGPPGADAGLGQMMNEARFSDLIAVAGTDGVEELLQRLHADLCLAQATLDDAVGRNDRAEIRAQTHIVIAISGAVGAERLHRCCEVLNIAAKRGQLDDLAPLYAPCRADLSALIAYVAGQAAAHGAALS
jgi:CheY-like chemotaxis protein